MELIRTAAAQTQGKSGKSLAPIMMALITNANKKGIQFTPDEFSLVLSVLKDGKSKEEQDQIYGSEGGYLCRGCKRRKDIDQQCVFYNGGAGFQR